MLNVLKGLVLKVGFSGNVVLVSGIVQRFMKFGCLDSGVKSFHECHFGCLDNVIWSVVIHGYAKNGVYDKGRECFAKMLRFGFEFNEFCLSGVVGCVFNVREGEAIHGWCVKKGWLLGGFSMHLCNAIMVMYGRCGRRWDGVKLFDEMCEQGVLSWTGRIGVAFDCWDAFEIFKRCVLSGCEVHAMVWKGGFLGMTSVCNALISMYAKSGKMDEARCVFDEMVYRDYVSWNSLISGYSQHRLSNQAIGYSENVFSEIDSVDVIHVNAMLGAYDHCGCYSEVQTLFYRRWNSSLNIDTTTFNIVIKFCAALSDLHQGKSLHSLAIKTAISADKFIETAVIDVYSKCGSIEDAEHILLSACNIYGNVDVGMVAARELVGLQPENESSFVLLSNLYASAGMWSDVR
nr:hypothetical protein [Tanacetum cinerariifolium]